MDLMTEERLNYSKNLTELFELYMKNNSTMENINMDDYIMKILALRVFFYCIYLLIFLIGIFGNVLVCYVVFRNKSMMSVTNFFITNLALSDILLCIFAVPFTPLYLLTFRVWVFGGLLCHLVPFAQGVSVYISAFTLMSIAIDRFFVIIYPFKPRMKIKVCVIIIVCIWLASSLLTLPYAIFMDIILDGDNPYCDEVWPHEESRRAFGFSTSVLQFVIPFIIISFCYISVCGKLSDRARSMPGAKSARKEEQERERTQKTNRMLISMVIIFGVSWLPLNCHNLVLDFYIAAAQWRFSRAFFLLSHAVAMSSTCYNPFLYAWLNENFRKEFKQVLPCFRPSSSSSSSNTTLNSTKMRKINTNKCENLHQPDSNTIKTNSQIKQCNGNSNKQHSNSNNIITLAGSNCQLSDAEKSDAYIPHDAATDVTNITITNSSIITKNATRDNQDNTSSSSTVQHHQYDQTQEDQHQHQHQQHQHQHQHQQHDDLVVKYDRVYHEVEIINASKSKNNNNNNEFL